MAVIKEKKIGRQGDHSDHLIFRSLKYIHEKYTSIKTSMLIEDSDENDFDGQLN